MIEARHFVEAARERGFEWYAGVPCSYLTPFINYVLQDPSLHYVSMANEGDAVALIAGVALRGPGGGHRRGISMMQNSGLGNAVSPLTSLTWTFRLPQLLIVTWRAQPGVPDEPQHALMGPITPDDAGHDGDPLGAVSDRDRGDRSGARSCDCPYGRHRTPVRPGDAEGHVAPYALRPGPAWRYALPAGRASVERHCDWRPRHGLPGRTPSGRSLLARLQAQPPCSRRPASVAASCTRSTIGPTSSTWWARWVAWCRLALGLALARPDLRVVALDGDGAALMRMGAFATVGSIRTRPIFSICCWITVYTTQPAVRRPCRPRFVCADCRCLRLRFLARNRCCDPGLARLARPAAARRARFARLLTRPGTPADLPRPSVTPVDVKTRLMQHFGSLAGAR